jgi:hypothetical protein
MLDWFGHQLAVWRYGAGVLMMLAVTAFVSVIVGSVLAGLVSWLADQAFTGTLWLICSLVAAPFFLPDLARHIADMVREAPPPRSGDLFRKRIRKGKV